MIGVKLPPIPLILFASILSISYGDLKLPDTLPALKGSVAPTSLEDMWIGFDPKAEPLDVEILKEWEEDGVKLKVLRYRIGVFKGQKAMMAAVYGYPKNGKSLPGLVQIHGGGQYADYRAPLSNAKRGYASISISWAGRIFAPGYTVRPNDVNLFWEGNRDHPSYKLTTDWGALDGYHAPSRNGKDAFREIPVADWTLDPIESPRNSSWFLAALGARRALTFLEQQPQVNGSMLGVYGHSMGGKLTVLTAGSDNRVKASAPSCGGISDRYSKNPLHLNTVSDPPSLKNLKCPIIFLSPSNDFHGRINDLKTAVQEIKSKDWRVTCSPHGNHQDTAPYEVATQLWFDQHLKGTYSMPKTPTLEVSLPEGKSPLARISVDETREVDSLDIFYTQHGKGVGEKLDLENTKHRFWHHAPVSMHDGQLEASLQIYSVDKPLWVYANASYKIGNSVSAVGYYYSEYSTKSFTLSSLMETVAAAELHDAGSATSLKKSLVIEDFKGAWKKEWFSYNPDKWGIKTNKLYSQAWSPPLKGKLCLGVRSQSENKLTIGLDRFATELALSGGDAWQEFELTVDDFKDVELTPLKSWRGVKQLRLDHSENLRPPRNSKMKPLRLGAEWQGNAPEFRNLRWELN
mgnify:CR=1 FL=1